MVRAIPFPKNRFSELGDVIGKDGLLPSGSTLQRHTDTGVESTLTRNGDSIRAYVEPNWDREPDPKRQKAQTKSEPF